MTRNMSVIDDEQTKIFASTAKTLEVECENQSSTGSAEDEHGSWKNSDVSTPERREYHIDISDCKHKIQNLILQDYLEIDVVHLWL